MEANKITLIQKYLRDELSENELSEFTDLFCDEINSADWDQAIEGKKEWLQLQIMDDHAALLKGYSQLLEHINNGKQSGNKTGINRRRIWTGAIAAIFIAAIGIALFYGKDQRRKIEVSIQVPVSKTKHVLLADSSEVWINNKSVIQFEQTEFNKKFRNVYLEGEAYFQVAKDEKKPFIVQLKDFQIKVTGTSFDVKSYNDEDEVVVSLKTGLVELQGISSKDIVLNAGQQFIYNKSSKAGIIREVEVSNFTSWRSGQLKFDHVTLKSVAKALERWYGVEIMIKDESMKDFILTLRQKDNSLQEVLHVISFITGLKYSQNGKTITLYK